MGYISKIMISQAELVAIFKKLKRLVKDVVIEGRKKKEV